ncbi:MAG: hypothetical protein KDE08_06575 [Rhodobacteraceae bacterium]|nr:hypothetical protein [Paracoccaceae bacterium]
MNRLANTGTSPSRVEAASISAATDNQYDRLGILGFGGLLAILILMGGQAMSLPPNPQRPFDATTCDAAVARLDEALTGSPLISAAENSEVVVLAKEQVRRLCGDEAETKIEALTKSHDCPSR